MSRSTRGFSNYDRWKLSNAEDEEESYDLELRRRQDREDHADYEHDREKDERADREYDREQLDRSVPDDVS